MKPTASDRDGEEVIAELYASQVCERLAALKRPPPASDWDTAQNLIRLRHFVLAPESPPASHPFREHLDAQRGSWRQYLATAASIGLLDADVKARLTGDDDEDFRGAMAECLTAWFLAQRLGRRVVPRADGTRTKNADFSVADDGGEAVRVEVKAPYLNMPSWADHVSTIRACVMKAKDQLKKEHMNLVVLVPFFPIEIHSARTQLVDALIGHTAWRIPVVAGNEPAGKVETVFKQQGNLAKLWPKTGGGVTAYQTRIGAVMSIEERLTRPWGPVEMTQAAVVVHNPFAEHPIAPAWFDDLPQFLVEGEYMKWTDGYSKPR